MDPPVWPHRGIYPVLPAVNGIEARLKETNGNESKRTVPVDSHKEGEREMPAHAVNGCVPIDDTDMYYVSFGTGSRSLIMLPGLSDGLTTVQGKAWLLAGTYRKYLRDFTVYMFSRKNKMPEGYTIRQMAADQAAVMEKLGIRRACIAGVSQGGMIAQYLAIDHPELVEKLVLAVTAPCANESSNQVIQTWIDLARQGDHIALMNDTAEKMYTKAYLKKNRRLLSFVARLTKPADYERFLINALAILDFDARSELHRITCPTLILAGSDDHTVGNEAPYELNQSIPDSELYIFEGYGHGVFEEDRTFYDKILEFLK